jgi:NADPH:quinone reductase-like Zn-dependent oxidoreductase
MKAVQYEAFGGPENVKIAEVDEPHAGAGQIRIAVRAVSINPVDWKLGSGAMGGELPLPIGRDVAGVVDEVGDGADDVAAGDEVFGFADGGGAAEYALLSDYAKLPNGLDFAAAAALPVAIETATRTLGLLGVSGGQTVLVNGAAGGVGAATVQLARERGARVIGTASERNHDYLRSLGAEPVSYGDGLVARVRELAPDGVGAAIDVAGAALADLVELTGSPDRVVTIASYEDAQKLGVTFSGGMGTGRALSALTDVPRLIEEGRFELPVTKTYSLDEAAEALRESQAGHVRGKLVLLVG